MLVSPDFHTVVDLRLENEGFPLQSPPMGPAVMHPVLAGHVLSDSDRPTQAGQRLKPG